MNRDKLLNSLQRIDRRTLYILVVVVVALPFMLNMSLPIYVTPPVQRAYDAVASTPKDKIVLLVTNWEPGTRGESEPQTEALIRHMFKQGVKFAIFAHNTPIGPGLAQRIAERNASRFHKTYGVDWVSWGYKPASEAMIQGLPRDIWKIVGADYKGTPIGKVPLMKNVKTIKDVSLVIDVSPAMTVGIWIQYVQGRYGTPIVFSPTAVMVAESYPYLASRQLIGMLPGLRGAAEYEKLVEIPGYASRAMNAQSMAHLLIMFLIILGNIGYIASRRRKGAS